MGFTILKYVNWSHVEVHGPRTGYQIEYNLQAKNLVFLETMFYAAISEMSTWLVL